MASNKNITMKEFNGTDYNTLYPKTLDSQGLLTGSNITDYKVNTVSEALALIAGSITLQAALKLKVVDPVGYQAIGCDVLLNNKLLGTTDSNGQIIVVVPYGTSSLLVKNGGYFNYSDTNVQIQPAWIGDGNYHEVSINGANENGVVRYTESFQGKFSQNVKNVDVCLVGSGGNGSVGDESSPYGDGGGSGGILNAYGINVDSAQTYPLIIGAINNSTTTSFLNNSVKGAKNATAGTPNGLAGGHKTASITGNGNGNSNTTISEFDDGVTFYGGSGGAAGRTGGTPNGGDGKTNSNGENAKGPGGGGGGAYYEISTYYKGGSGGTGLVAIRVHYN